MNDVTRPPMVMGSNTVSETETENNLKIDERHSEHRHIENRSLLLIMVGEAHHLRAPSSLISTFWQGTITGTQNTYILLYFMPWLLRQQHSFQYEETEHVLKCHSNGSICTRSNNGVSSRHSKKQTCNISERIRIGRVFDIQQRLELKLRICGCFYIISVSSSLLVQI